MADRNEGKWWFEIRQRVEEVERGLENDVLGQAPIETLEQTLASLQRDMETLRHHRTEIAVKAARGSDRAREAKLLSGRLQQRLQVVLGATRRLLKQARHDELLRHQEEKRQQTLPADLVTNPTLARVAGALAEEMRRHTGELGRLIGVLESLASEGAE